MPNKEKGAKRQLPAEDAAAVRAWSKETKQATKSNFEKDLCKRSNNSVFGKCGEHVNNHMKLKLTTENEKAIALFL